MQHNTRRWRFGKRRSLVAAALATVMVVACGSEDPSTTQPDAGEPTAPAETESDADNGGSTDLEELIAAAQAEGEVTCYVASSERVVDQINEQFSATYGINARCERITGGPLTERVRQELAAGRGYPDLVFHNDQGFQRDIEQEGAVVDLSSLPHAETAAETFREGWWNPTGPYIAGVYMNQIYNTDNVSPDEVPQTWEDVLDPKWNGRIIALSPASGAATGAYWLNVMEQVGDDFFERLGELDVQTVDLTAEGVQLVGAGSRDLLLISSAFSSKGALQSGAPVAELFLGRTYLFNSSISVLDGSPNPNAGLLLANWLLTRDGQCAIACDESLSSALPDLDSAIELPEEWFIYDIDYLDANLTRVLDMYEQFVR